MQKVNDSIKTVKFSDLFVKNRQIGGLGGIEIEDYANLIIRGGMPALINETPEIAQEAMIDFVENIAYVDMRTLPASPTPERIAALIRSLSRNISTESSLEKLAGETGFTDKSTMATSTVTPEKAAQCADCRFFVIYAKRQRKCCFIRAFNGVKCRSVCPFVAK